MIVIYVYVCAHIHSDCVQLYMYVRTYVHFMSIHYDLYGQLLLVMVAKACQYAVN